jgi:dUTPase
MEIKVLETRKNSATAIIPIRSEKYYTGLDFFSAYDYKIKPNGKKIIDTEIKIQIPEKLYGHTTGNNEYSYENHCTILGTIIDKKFKDTVKFNLFNHGNKKIMVPHGQLIGHLLVVEKLIYPIARNVDVPDSDDDAEGRNGLSNKFEKLEIGIN